MRNGPYLFGSFLRRPPHPFQQSLHMRIPASAVALAVGGSLPLAIGGAVVLAAGGRIGAVARRKVAGRV
ncbi:hypothetical protein GCM10010502_35660 [Kitasatospora aureofaciens]|uniref:Uncharacterized protein n=1 Tax=Kitasatospora aureofaciens TaxID=1894 RepID=A0A8H9LP73_KITAU|nr:hypothetical protein GCM10010502_35660 [Kitasatospora aureofaciens]